MPPGFQENWYHLTKLLPGPKPGILLSQAGRLWPELLLSHFHLKTKFLNVFLIMNGYKNK
jgi:hypothetical protein